MNSYDYLLSHLSPPCEKMNIRKWIRENREKFWGWIPPKWLVRIQWGWHFLHRLLQRVAYFFRGKRYLGLLLFFSVELLIIIQILQRGLTYLSQNSSQNSSQSLLHNVSLNVSQTLPQDLSQDLSLNGLWSVLFIYTLVLIIYLFWRTGSNLVIEEFADDSDEGIASVEKGIASLLIVEINRINQLYLDVGEQRPLQTSSGDLGQITAVLKVDETGEILKSTIGEAIKIKVGPFELPLYGLVSLVNRISGGPRIRGNIRRRDDAILVTASMSGGDIPFSWKITKKITKKTAPTPSENKTPGDPLEEAVRELACRIFTDVPTAGSFKWEANDHFHKGLRKYRECLRTPKDQVNNLTDAETEFLQTLSYDNLFTTAWYNLGVVYLESGKTSAAEEAFLRALEHDPTNADYHYALALTRFNCMIFATDPITDAPVPKPGACMPDRDILQHSMQATILRQEYAENFNLMALVHLEMFKNEMKQHKSENPISPDKKDRCDHLKQALSCQKKAVAACWKQFYQINMYEKRDDFYINRQWNEKCQFLASCIRDLARILIYQELSSNSADDNKNSKPRLELPEYLLKTSDHFSDSLPNPCPCPEIHWTKGMLHLCRGGSEYSKAEDEFRTAIRIHPGTMKYQVSLGLALHLSNQGQSYPGNSSGGSHPLDTALPLVLKAWKERECMVRNQWESLSELFQLIEWSGLKSDENFQKFKTSAEDIKKCSKLIYDANELLDAFNPDLAYPVEKYYVHLHQNISASESIPLHSEVWPLVSQWYRGHISHLQGRYEYLKSDYLSWNIRSEEFTEENKPYKIAEKHIMNAYREFSDVPREIIRHNLLSKLAITQAKMDTNYPHAIFTSIQDHWTNPFSDYQHSISALLHVEIKDFESARQQWREAIIHGYGVPDFNHYALSRYLENICLTTLRSNGNEPIKEDSEQDTENLVRYNKALALLYAGFDKAVSRVGTEYIVPLTRQNLQNQSERQNGTSPEWIHSLYLGMREYSPDTPDGASPEQTRIICSIDIFRKSNGSGDQKAPNIYKLQANGYLKEIFSVRFKMGEYHLRNKHYQKAIDQFAIISCMCGPPDVCRSGSPESWRGFREYLISILEMGDAYTQMEHFDNAQECYTKIIGFRHLMEGHENSGRYFCYSFRIRIHPLMILIRAYLELARIHAYTGIEAPEHGITTSKSLTESCKLYKKLEMTYNVNNLRRADSEYFDENIHRVRSDYLKIQGMIALDITNQPDEAIPLLEKSISIRDDAESYVYLLRALDKIIPPEANYSLEMTKQYDKSSRYLANLTRIGVPEAHLGFVDGFREKIRNVPKPSRGGGKEGTKKYYIVPCTGRPGSPVVICRREKPEK